MRSLDICEKALSLLTELSGLERIRREDRLREDLGLDSLSMVSLLVRIEEEFGFELRESDINPAALQTAEDVVSLAERYAEEAA